jgi:hypothetical protein
MMLVSFLFLFLVAYMRRYGYYKGLERETGFEGTEVSTASEETCLLCVQQEAARLLSMCLDVGLELKTREDVMNLIVLSGHSYLYKDPAFVEEVIDTFLEQA